MTPEQFERDTNGTPADWLRWLPAACGDCPLALGDGTAVVQIGSGRLHLDWQVLAPRRIALVALPRMLVRYRFEGVEAAQRQHFLQHFDLVMQRGGG